MKKKFLAPIVTIVLLFSFSLNTFAQEDVTNSANTIEQISDDQLSDDGISILIIRNDDGSYRSSEVSADQLMISPCSEGVDGVIDWAVFHLGFKDWNDDGDLYFTVSADEPLSNVSGYVYVKSTSIFSPTTYYGNSFSRNLLGSSNTSRFLSQNIDVNGDSSVRVGFTGVTIVALSGDAAAIPNNSKVVYK